jgi:hypothetical protein
MNATGVAVGGVSQVSEITLVVALGIETRLTVVAALNEVLGNAR